MHYHFDLIKPTQSDEGASGNTQTIDNYKYARSFRFIKGAHSNEGAPWYTQTKDNYKYAISF